MSSTRPLSSQILKRVIVVAAVGLAIVVILTSKAAEINESTEARITQCARTWVEQRGLSAQQARLDCEIIHGVHSK